MRQHRVVGIRPSFEKPDEESKLLATVAVVVVVALVVQGLILLGHGAWLLEQWAWGLFHG